MQTFLPYANFKKSAQVLDNRRLGKQRVEVLTLLRGKWQNHPCARMWRGHEWALSEYGYEICREWIRRGFKDTCMEKILQWRKEHTYDPNVGYFAPAWFGNAAFHRAHQSNLVRKFSEHYRQFFPDVPDDLPYIWGNEY